MVIFCLSRLGSGGVCRTGTNVFGRTNPEVQELAYQLGTVRELVSRNLMRLQAEGLVQVEARNITVLDLPGLTAILDSSS